jgi:hypothetical protein
MERAERRRISSRIMADWEIVTTVGTDEEAALVAGYLESAGIRAEVESLRFHQEPVNFGRLGEVRVRVASADLEAARRLLAESGAAADAAGAVE